MTNEAQIVVYGTTWCGDCRRSKRFLDAKCISYVWVDIEENRESLEYVRRVNHGPQSVPTIVFPDGSILVEPSDAELARKLDL